MFCCKAGLTLAYNYLEKHYEEYLKSKTSGGEARRLRWRKQLKAQQARQKSEAQQTKKDE